MTTEERYKKALLRLRMLAETAQHEIHDNLHDCAWDSMEVAKRLIAYALDPQSVVGTGVCLYGVPVGDPCPHCDELEAEENTDG